MIFMMFLIIGPLPDTLDDHLIPIYTVTVMLFHIIIVTSGNYGAQIIPQVGNPVTRPLQQPSAPDPKPGTQHSPPRTGSQPMASSP